MFRLCRLAPLVSLIAALALCLGPARAAPVADSLLVRFRAAAPSERALLAAPANRRALAAQPGLERVEALLPGRGIVRLRFRGDAARALAALRRDPGVVYAERDQTAKAFLVPNDPFYPNQWALPKVSAPAAWDISIGSAAVIVAVLDSGVDPAHPDLASKLEPGYNAITVGSNTDDDNGHGTHVAGIAAAATDNALGMAGAGFNARLLPVKVLDASGSGYYSDIIEGIGEAANRGAKVINLSLGGSAFSQAMQDAVNYAWSLGAVVVAAAGNEGNQVLSYPAALDNVIAVASTDANDRRAGSSSYGAWVDVAAPGVNLVSTTPTHGFTLETQYGIPRGYAALSGTSMACPMVAGQAALLFAAAGLDAAPAAVADAVQTTMDAVPDPTIPGRVNFARALLRITTPAGGGTGLRGEYFDNSDLTAPVGARIDPTIDFDWGVGAPDQTMGVDTFSVRWSGQIAPEASDTYTFYTTSDDGVRLWVNGQLIIDNWTDHAPTENAGTPIALSGGERYDIRLEYFENGGGAQVRLEWQGANQPRQIIPQARLYPAPPQGTGTGLRGAYFDNTDFTAERLSRTDAAIDFDWGIGSPDASVGPDTFSVRWTGEIEPRFTEEYAFLTTSDDGVRLWIDGQLIIDNWTDHAPTIDRGSPIPLVAGRRYAIRLEYFENGGGATARLEWQSASQAREVVPQGRLSPP